MANIETALSGLATLEDMYALAEQGYEFVIEDGVIANVLHR